MTPRGTDAPSPVGQRTLSAHRWGTVIGHRDALVRLARRHGAGVDAEDVAHEAMLRSAINPTLDPTRALSYLATITRNLAVDLHRRAARERSLRKHAGLTPRPWAPTEDVEDRDLAEHAARLVSGLPAEMREVLSLRCDGASWSQIGERIGKPPATAEMRYRRAMAPLRRRLSTS